MRRGRVSPPAPSATTNAARTSRNVRAAGQAGRLPHLAGTRTELFIVEGDSALGTAQLARNSEFEALLPIRGKILNVEKSSSPTC